MSRVVSIERCSASPLEARRRLDAYYAARQARKHRDCLLAWTFAMGFVLGCVATVIALGGLR